MATRLDQNRNPKNALATGQQFGPREVRAGMGNSPQAPAPMNREVLALLAQNIARDMARGSNDFKVAAAKGGLTREQLQALPGQVAAELPDFSQFAPGVISDQEIAANKAAKRYQPKTTIEDRRRAIRKGEAPSDLYFKRRYGPQTAEQLAMGEEELRKQFSGLTADDPRLADPALNRADSAIGAVTNYIKNDILARAAGQGRFATPLEFQEAGKAIGEILPYRRYGSGYVSEKRGINEGQQQRAKDALGKAYENVSFDRPFYKRPNYGSMVAPLALSLMAGTVAAPMLASYLGTAFPATAGALGIGAEGGIGSQALSTLAANKAGNLVR